MSTFKPLLSRDVIVTPFTVNKSFTFSPSEFSEVGVDRFTGQNISSSHFIPNGEDTTGTLSTQYRELIYDSIKQLYYSNYTKNAIASGSFDNSLTSPNSDFRVYPRDIGSFIGVISIPQKLYGDYINPKTFSYTASNTLGIRTITDDGQGNLKLSSTGEFCGNILYHQGIAIITSEFVLNTVDETVITGEDVKYGSATYGQSIYGGESTLTELFADPFISDNGDHVKLSFESAHTIYESQYKCSIKEDEFNYSYNPSLLESNITIASGSSEYKGFVTGSVFSPYVTTLGLYNDNQELLAVAKLAQPLPTSITTDTTILVNLDR